LALILTLILVGIVGLLLAGRYRITSVVLAGLIFVFAIIVLGAVEGWSIAQTAILVAASLTVINAAYLLGLFLFRILRGRSENPNGSR
jgi:hypothetical protein